MSRRSRDYADGEHSSDVAVAHIPCPNDKCGSHDAFCTYTDGHGACFSCRKTYSAKQLTKLGYDAEAQTPSHSASSGKGGERRAVSEEFQVVLDASAVKAIPSRKLTQATTRHFNYRVRVNGRGEQEHVAVYTDPQGRPVGAKVRNCGQDGAGKGFAWIGETTRTELFGQHLWGASGKMLIVTEGEIDAMTVAQCWGNKFPVVSVPNGAATARKDLARHLEWVNTFEKVVLMFDMDQQGRTAAEECASLLPPGKAFIASLPEKDPNAVLLAHGQQPITDAAHNAKPYRPDGLVDARDLTERCLNPVIAGIPWPYPFMTKWTYGRRPGEVYVFGGGTGIGKTDVLAEIVACTVDGKDVEGKTFTPEGFAVFGYESGPAGTKKAIAGKLWSRRFHIPQEDAKAEGAEWTDAELTEAMAYMDTDCWERGGRLFINDSFGAADWEAVKARARFLRHSEDIRHFAVDPLSALVIGVEDERKELDRIVMESAMLSQELDSNFYLFSHLTRPGFGPPHEEGGRVQLNHFRGSGGIVMFAFFCFGLERDQQAEDLNVRCETTYRVLKDRYTGNSTGKTQKLHYNVMNGRLEVVNMGDDLA